MVEYITAHLVYSSNEADRIKPVLLFSVILTPSDHNGRDVTWSRVISLSNTTD